MPTIHHDHADDILGTHMDKLNQAAQRAYGKLSGLAVPLGGVFDTGKPVHPERILARQVAQEQMVQYVRDAIVAATDVLIAIAAAADEPEIPLVATVTLRIDNVYSDGHQSSQTHEVAAPSGEVDTAWWNLVGFPVIGDGHGLVEDVGLLATATIVAADNPNLIGKEFEWIG